MLNERDRRELAHIERGLGEDQSLGSLSREFDSTVKARRDRKHPGQGVPWAGTMAFGVLLFLAGLLGLGGLATFLGVVIMVTAPLTLEHLRGVPATHPSHRT